MASLPEGQKWAGWLCVKYDDSCMAIKIMNIGLLLLTIKKKQLMR
jgi:hypothetical protein